MKQADQVRPAAIRDDETAVSAQRFARAVLCVGLSAVAFAAIAGCLAYWSGQSLYRRFVAAHNMTLAQTLAQLGSTQDKADPRDGLEEVVSVWHRASHEYPTSFLCVMSADGRLLYHSRKPEMKGTDVRSVTAIPAEHQSVGDLLRTGREWSGENANFRGIRQLVAYARFRPVDGMLAVHIPLQDVDAEYRAAMFPWLLGLGVICIAIVPGSLFVSFGISRRGWKSAMTARQQLAAQYASVKRMTDSLPQVVWLMGASGNCTYVNSTWQRVFGQDMHTAAGDGWRSVIYSEDAEVVENRLQRLLQRGEEFAVECRLYNSERQLRWFQLTGNILQERADGIDAFVGTGVDITARRATAEAVKLSEERHRGFSDHSRDALFLVEYDPPVPLTSSEDEVVQQLLSAGHIAAGNARLARFLGLSAASQLAGLSARSVLIPGGDTDAEFIRLLVRMGFSVDDVRSDDVDASGMPRVYERTCRGVIEHGCLVRIWGTLADVTERLAIERELICSQDTLEEVLQHAQVGSWEYHPETQAVIWSNEMKRLYHLLPDQAPPGTLEGLLNLIHPDDRDTVLHQHELLWHSDAPLQRFDLRTNPENGPMRWLNACNVRRRYQDTGMMFAAGTVIDITDRKTAELRLAENEARLRAIIETEPACVKLVSPDGRLLDMNASGLALIQADKIEQVRDLDVLKLVAPEYRTEFQELHDAVLRGETRQLEFEIQGLRGSRRRLLTSATPLRNSDGAVIGHLAVTQDVTESRRRDEALRLSEARYRSFLVASAATVWITDAAGRFSFPQPSWERYTGSPWEEHRGYGWVKKLHPDDRLRLKDAWLSAISEEPDLFVNEGRLWHAASQDYHHFEVRAVPIRDADGCVTEWVGTTTDIHQRRLAEQELLKTREQLLHQQRRETERVRTELDRLSKELVRHARLATIGQVSAQIAHDLRNPLGAVRNAAFFLKTELPQGNAQISGMLNMIDREVETCDTIIRNLLDVSQPRTLLIAPVDVAEVANAAVDRIRTSGQADVVLRIERSPFIWHVDAVQFRQLLDNLLSNACEAVGTGGSVDVTLVRSGEYLQLTVRDDGPGVPQAALETVFEPFHTTKRFGTGLGLTNCRDIVDRHQGTIHVEAPSDGGTVFIVRLPEGPVSDDRSGMPETLRA